MSVASGGDGAPANLSTVVLILERARTNRLPSTLLYRRHFLAVVHALASQRSGEQASLMRQRAACDEAGAICVPYVRHPGWPAPGRGAHTTHPHAHAEGATQRLARRVRQARQGAHVLQASDPFSARAPIRNR
jgi:hypothetical protein